MWTNDILMSRFRRPRFKHWNVKTWCLLFSSSLFFCDCERITTKIQESKDFPLVHYGLGLVFDLLHYFHWHKLLNIQCVCDAHIRCTFLPINLYFYRKFDVLLWIKRLYEWYNFIICKSASIDDVYMLIDVYYFDMVLNDCKTVESNKDLSYIWYFKVANFSG